MLVVLVLVLARISINFFRSGVQEHVMLFATALANCCVCVATSVSFIGTLYDWSSFSLFSSASLQGFVCLWCWRVVVQVNEIFFPAFFG